MCAHCAKNEAYDLCPNYGVRILQSVDGNRCSNNLCTPDVMRKGAGGHWLKNNVFCMMRTLREAAAHFCFSRLHKPGRP